MDIKKHIKEKIKLYKQEFDVQNQAIRAAAEQIKVDIAAGKRDPVKASSFLILQQNIIRTQTSIKVLEDLLNEI
jgi:hypothetical protein